MRLGLLRGLAAGIASFAAACTQAQEVLSPQEAYPYELEASADRLLVKFDIPDGYYLYREKFGFEAESDSVSLGQPVFPRGESHEDEFFGEQEIYRHDFEISIPYTLGASVDELELQLRLQGCADIGLCYPPQRWRRTVELPAGAFAAPVAGSLRQGAAGLPGGADVLPADQAFVANARFDSANELTVGWQIAPGYYLYRDKFEFAVDGGIQLGEPRLPDGVPHYDDNFGDVAVYYDYVEIDVPFARASADELPIEITLGYQGCKEQSICYPPDEQTLAMVLPPSSDFAVSAPTGAAPSGPGAAAVMVSEQDHWAARILSDSWPVMLGLFYVLGLGLSFTPCVLPMVPILSSIIAGQGGAVSTSKGFLLSLSYVLGMAVTYTAAGALAALAGGQIQALFQKPWIVSLFAGLFVVLALGMFGLFELQVPAAIQTRLSNLANRQRGGTFIGTAIIGALTALIVTTCVAPPLIGALTVIGQSGDVVRGAGALFALSIGMGSPLLLVGASAGQLLPRVGPWMNAVKAAFGVMMIGIAIWMLERVLPGSVTLLLWALLVFLSGVFLGAFEPLPEKPHAARRLAKGVGVLACLYGALMLIGSTLGGNDPLRPLPRGAFAGGGMLAAEQGPGFEDLGTIAELEAHLAAARAAGRPVMVDFTAEWCVSCKEMEEFTFPDPGVIAALEPFVLLRADVTANDDDDQALLEYFSSYGPPTIAFYDASGRIQQSYTLIGYVRAAQFKTHVERVAAL